MSRWLRPSLDTVPHPPDGDNQDLLSKLNIGLGDNDTVPSQCIHKTKKFMLEPPILGVCQTRAGM
jgi:hypothetical protein